MLKQQAKLFNNISQLVDIILIIASFWLAYAYRVSLGEHLEDIRDYLWIMLIVIPTWRFLIAKYSLYTSVRTVSIYRIISSLAKVHLIGGVVTASVLYLLDPAGFNRELFGSFMVISAILLTSGKLSMKGVLSLLRKRGYNTRNLVIIGDAKQRNKFEHLVKEHSQWGLTIAGVFQLSEHPHKNDQAPVLADVDALVEFCKLHPIDEVIFCLARNDIQNIDDYVFEMDLMGVAVRMVLDSYRAHRTYQEVAMFHGALPILTFHCLAFDSYELFLKRCLDIFGALVGLVLTFILLPFIALAIKIDSPGPLLFGQQRVGEHGRLFTCWKFRSMYIDAEKRKQELTHLNEMSGAIFKIKNDPRITKVGHFIRKTSLDELPQFWNVLRGEMALVGTRPPTPDEVAHYENWHRRRISIKPGITGLWQISGRNQIQDFDDIVRLDLEYIDKWNIWLDIKILLKTFKVVFVREGSC